jgi:hypothetical protein
MAGVALAGALLADFRYDQTTRITKGMVTKMAFGKKPELETSTSYFKGDRMAVVSKTSKTVIDFDKQLFLAVEDEKKQYWQMTFAEMQQMMADLEAEMKEATQSKDVNVAMKFSAKATGVEKDVNGFLARQVIFTIDSEASDSKQPAGMMKMVNDCWQSEKVTGYSE